MRCLCNVVANVIAQQEVGDIHTFQNISSNSKACTKFALLNESKMIKSVFTTNQFKVLYITGIVPFSDSGLFAASLVSGVVSFMVEGRVGSVKG